MSYLRYLRLFVYNGVQHLLCCVFCFVCLVYNMLTVSLDCPFLNTRIGGVMLSVLASSAVDRGFEARSDQIKDYKIGIYCFSGKPAVLIKERFDLI